MGTTCSSTGPQWGKHAGAGRGKDTHLERAGPSRAGPSGLPAPAMGSQILLPLGNCLPLSKAEVLPHT